MTPQEQAQVVMNASARARCGSPLCRTPAGDAAAIRAAVDLVLPEESEPDWGGWDGHEIEIFADHKRLRARLLAIVAELEAPTDAK